MNFEQAIAGSLALVLTSFPVSVYASETYEEPPSSAPTVMKKEQPAANTVQVSPQTLAKGKKIYQALHSGKVKRSRLTPAEGKALLAYEKSLHK